jgi:hypothetical protein
LDTGARARGGPLPENPLLRSGLAFAGANSRESSKADDDGILTGLEAASLDLRGTRLVVLSACETGVGDVKTGDGVYGLRRALVLAGSQTQVMSLWKVDDDATRALMTAYYARIERGGGRSDALREVQLAMLAEPRTSHPYYWAAFIAAGDETTLEGATPPAVRDAVATSAEAAARQMRVPGNACGCDVASEERVGWESVSFLILLVLARRQRWNSAMLVTRSRTSARSDSYLHASLAVGPEPCWQPLGQRADDCVQNPAH